MTLIELVVSLAVLSIIMVACGSAVTLAARAMNLGISGPAVQAAMARSAADQVVADLNVALGFSERSSIAASFTVPDRIGAGQPQTLRYAWSGAAGSTIVVGAVSYPVAPYTLTRQFNGGPPLSIADNVQAFNFNYLLRTVGQPSPPAPVESTEQVLLAHNGGTGGNIKTLSISSNKNWPGEYFYPGPFPSDTISWKITHVQVLLARNGGATGSLNVEIWPVDSSNKPTGAAIASATFDVTTISTTATWLDVPFTTLAVLDPTQGFAVVVDSAASSTVALISYDTNSIDTGMGFSTSSNSGSSWSSISTKSALQYYVYGTITEQAAIPPPAPLTPPTYQ